MSNETKIEERLRAAIEQIAPNQTARYDLLSTATRIARHKWVNWVNRRQSLSVEMLEAFLTGWPEMASWIATGAGTKPSPHMDRIDEIVLSRNDRGQSVTNIPHAVSQYGKGTPPAFEWGYDGSGPRELAMNILHVMGMSSPVADYFARHFTERFLLGIPQEGGSIDIKLVQNWLQEIKEDIQKKTDEHRRLEELRQAHETQVRDAMEKFNAGKE
ncbi:DUF6166 domain-containing protein [Chromobacterium vaccinii]|uniref:DUF6166 domain-containing protein n=1 Tax=Chromobacterium vaccinii TaxID=1108595 RepID=UPI000E1655F9|nr:DUF6166 domain-containing protein [Chromobacterium vaccinii]SUX54823.1 Uncharacterised protein [Chromobacterium vaccinii]